MILRLQYVSAVAIQHSFVPSPITL